MADIAFRKDLDIKLAKELGWDLKKVKENTGFLIKRLKNIMADPDVDHIILPHVGTMYTKTYILRKKIESAEHFERPVNTKWSSKVNRYKEVFKDATYDQFAKYHKRFRILNYYYTKAKNFKELQKFQNEQD